MGRAWPASQEVVGHAPPYSQCYGVAIQYMNILNQQALTGTEFWWGAVPVSKLTGTVMVTQEITKTRK